MFYIWWPAYIVPGLMVLAGFAGQLLPGRKYRSPQGPLAPERQKFADSLFLKLLRTVKRRSSWLDAILICLTGEMFLYSGMAVRDHTQEVHVMGSDEIHIYHAAVVHDNNRETVSIGTDAAVISD